MDFAYIQKQKPFGFFLLISGSKHMFLANTEEGTVHP